MTKDDIEKLQKVFSNESVNMDNVENLCRENLLYIAEKNDLKKVYIDYKDSTTEDDNVYSFNDFKKELLKGYGNSDCLEISRYIILSNGVWYDTEYC